MSIIEYDNKLKKLKLLERKIELQEGLPFLHAQKMYRWQREVFESRNRNLFLVAANQIGKSTIQWRRVINLATDQKLWKKYWRIPPKVFWYLYPTKEVATLEFNKKIKYLLPTGRFKDDPYYGWEAEYKNRILHSINFHNGVSIIMKSYGSDVSALQTGTVWYVACDEELPVELYPELTLRRAAVDGYFSMCFTATLNQAFWYEVMETKKRFPDAHKVNASLYDCLEYEDGSMSPWTLDRITRIENSCGSETEVQRRVYGRFVTEQGKRYPSFRRDRNLVPPEPVPSDWVYYCGVDPGGGGDGHPAAICIVAVHPEMTKGRVVKCWRGNQKENTTASDILLKFKDMSEGISFTGLYYDFSAKDFGIFAERDGIPFLRADKSRESGASLINSLFKNQILSIDDIEDNYPLVEELENLSVDARKQKAKDDQIDSMRYAVTKIPWDLSIITSKEIIKIDEPKQPLTIDQQRIMKFEPVDSWGLDDEIAEWNELYEP